MYIYCINNSARAHFDHEVHLIRTCSRYDKTYIQMSDRYSYIFNIDLELTLAKSKTLRTK